MCLQLLLDIVPDLLGEKKGSFFCDNGAKSSERCFLGSILLQGGHQRRGDWTEQGIISYTESFWEGSFCKAFRGTVEMEVFMQKVDTAGSGLSQCRSSH